MRVNRTRRAIFVFGYTAIFGAIAAAITLMGLEGPVAESAVTGFIGLIWVMIVSYLTTTTVDRSDILSKLSGRFQTRQQVQTPDQARNAVRTNNENGDDNVG